MPAAVFVWYEIERHYLETGWVRDSAERYDSQCKAEAEAQRLAGFYPGMGVKVVRVQQTRETVKRLG